MSLAVILQNASYFLDLSSAPYAVEFGSGLGLPQEDVVMARPWGRGYSPLAGVNPGNRMAPIKIAITGTSLDDWIMNSRQVHQILRQAQEFNQSGGMRGDRAYLSLQLAGMTYAIEYDIITAQMDDGAFAQPQMTRTTAPYMRQVAVNLEMRPYGRPQQLSRSSSSILSNGLSSHIIAAPAGDRPAPARMSMKLTSSGNSFQRAIVWRRSRGNVNNWIYALEAETGAHTGYVTSDITTATDIGLSNVANATAHASGVLRLTNHTTTLHTLRPILNWTINDNLSDFYGRYRVFITKPTDAGAYVTAFQLTYGGTAGTDIVLPSVTSHGGIMELGIIEIPARRLPVDAIVTSFIMTLRATTAAGGNVNARTADLDVIYLVPADEQIADVTFSAIVGSATTASGAVMVDDNLALAPALYAADASGDVTKQYPTDVLDSHFALEPGIDNLFGALTFTASDSYNLGHAQQITVEYFPLFDLFRDT